MTGTKNEQADTERLSTTDSEQTGEVGKFLCCETNDFQQCSTSVRALGNQTAE